MTAWRQLALVALTGLAGCGGGGFSSPDLSTGSIAGTVVGAHLDAFAYPLGRPDLVARVAADGSFRLDGLPAGALRLLVYDDLLPDGTRRGELIEVVVPGAGVARLERRGEAAPGEAGGKMAWAGAVAATIAPEGGGLARAPRFTVEGTTLTATAASGSDAALLGLLPAASGVYRLTVSAEGYLPAARSIDVSSATNGYGLKVEIDESGSGPRGCEAGGGCLNGLTCQVSTGRCVQCLGDGDCPAGASCDLDEHFCNAPPPGGGARGSVCSACSSDAQCAGGMLNPGRCDLASGAVTGSCTWAPIAASYCPAGFLLRPDFNGDERCVPAVTCAAYYATFGRACFEDETCQAGGAVAGAACRGADPVHGLPGYCTAACRSLATPPDTCVVPGFHCDPVLKFCMRS